MKRIITLFLVLSILLASCSPATVGNDAENTTKETTKETEVVLQNTVDVNSFYSLNDSELLSYIEDTVYADLVANLNSEKYFVENISAVYISKEYLEELEYNSRENIYFGYKLSELDEMFEGTRYVFDLGEDGTTIVREFEAYDDTYEKMFRNVATGAGVILLCVTVSCVTAGVPAVSLIFAASAKTGTTVALSSAVFDGVATAVVTGIQTGDVKEAIKSGSLAASEGFKWGAIIGSISGAVSETIALKGATRKGLTMNEAAKIQKESGLPLEFIKNFHSVDEYEAYKKMGLTVQKINGKWVYTQKIDWDLVDSKGRTNYKRVAEGLNPIDKSGSSFEVHHIGQENDSPLALLTKQQHKEYYSVLHKNTGDSPSAIDREAFEKIKRDMWKAYMDMTYSK